MLPSSPGGVTVVVVVGAVSVVVAVDVAVDVAPVSVFAVEPVPLAQPAIPAIALVATAMRPARPRPRRNGVTADCSDDSARATPQKGHVASSILTCLSQPEQSSSVGMR